MCGKKILASVMAIGTHEDLVLQSRGMTTAEDHIKNRREPLGKE